MYVQCTMNATPPHHPPLPYGRLRRPRSPIRPPQTPMLPPSTHSNYAVEVGKDGHGILHRADRGTAAAIHFTVPHHRVTVNCLAWANRKQVLVLGCEGGDLFIIDANSGTVVESLRSGVQTPSCLAFDHTDDGVLVGTMKGGGDVKRIPVKTAMTNNQRIFTKCDSKGVSCLAVNATMLATARMAIKIWNIDSGERLFKLSGHANQVIGMCFLPASSSSSSGLLASIAEGDTYVSIWNQSGISQFILSNESPALQIACSDLGNGLVGVLCTTKDGLCNVWGLPDSTPTNTSTITPSTTIRSSSSTKSSCVLSAAFLPSSNDMPSHSLTLLSSRPAAGASATHQGKKTIKTLHNTLSTRIFYENGIWLAGGGGGGSGNTDSTTPLINGVSDTDNDVVKRGVKSRLDRSAVAPSSSDDAATRKRQHIDTQDIPLSQRLTEMTRNLIVPPPTAASSPSPLLTTQQQQQSLQQQNSSGGKRASGMSMSRALDLAFQTDDRDQIEQVLSQSDEQVVESTILNLPISKLPKLVEELATRLEKRPGSARRVLQWLGALLRIRAVDLKRTPSQETDAALSRLYGLAEARIATFDQFLRLKGKLDVILASTMTDVSMNGTATAAAAATSSSSPTHTKALMEFDV